RAARSRRVRPRLSASPAAAASVTKSACAAAFCAASACHRVTIASASRERSRRNNPFRLLRGRAWVPPHRGGIRVRCRRRQARFFLPALHQAAPHLTLPWLRDGSLPLPLRAYRIHTSWLRSGRKTDSVIPLASDGVGHGIGVWAGAVWRPPPAKRGACLHEALVARPGSCIRRLGGTRSREMRFTRFLRNAAVTADEMSRHAGALTA